MPEFEMNKYGCIEARKWLKQENLLDQCGPSDCDGITFITCANELYEQHINSPYYAFAEIHCLINDMTKLLENGELRTDDMDNLSELVGDMVSGFTDIIVKLGDFDEK